MRRLGVLIVALAVLAGQPASAAPDPYGLLAMIAAGLSDGGQVAMGGDTPGKVTRSGPKAFQVNLPSGQMGFLYAQPQPCVFTQTSQIKGKPPLTVQFDFNLVTGVRFEQQGKMGNLNAIALVFDGTGEIVDFVADDGTMTATQPRASVITSLTVDQLGKAAAALHALCPNK